MQKGQDIRRTTTVGLLETPLHPSLGPPGHAGTAFPTISITTTPANPVLLEKMDPLPCMPGFQCHFSLEQVTAAPVLLPLASPVPPPPHPHASGREDQRPPARTPGSLPLPVPLTHPSGHPLPHLQAALPWSSQRGWERGPPRAFPGPHSMASAEQFGSRLSVRALITVANLRALRGG